MIVLRLWIFEHFKLFFSLAMLASVYKICQTCACTAAMYGVNVPFSEFLM